ARFNGVAGMSTATIAEAKGAQVTRGNRARDKSAIPSTQGRTARAKTAPLSMIGISTPGTREASAWNPAGYAVGSPVEFETEPTARLDAVPVSRIRWRAERW